jgi:hypothetical protein
MAEARGGWMGAYIRSFNIGGVMPMFCRACTTTFPRADAAAFDLLEDGGLLWNWRKGKNAPFCARGKPLYAGTVCQRGDTYAIRAAAQAASLEGDGLEINALVHFIEHRLRG